MSKVALNKLCKKGISTLRQKDIVNDGPYPIYGASGIVGYSSSYQNAVQCVAVVKDGAGVGRANICDARSSVLGTMQALIPVDDVECDYLLHLVRSLRLGEGFTGSTVPHIYFKDYGKRLVLERSTDEQRHIANLLNAIESRISIIDVQRDKLDELVKSRFVEMFGAMTDTVPLGTICNFKSGKSLPKKQELEAGPVIYAKVGDLNLPGNEIAITMSRTYVTEDTAKSSLIPSGAVVFPKRGGAIGTNKKRITVQDCCLDLNLMSVIPGNQITTEYLRWYFELLDLNEIANGSTVPQINNKDLEPLPIAVPSLALQQEFAAFVQQVDKLKSIAQQQIDKLQILYDSLAQEYFSAE